MSGVVGNRSHYHDPYANLAAAILESGARCNDTRFLESDWAETLREVCALDDKMYGNRNVKAARAKVHVSSPHMEVSDE